MTRGQEKAVWIKASELRSFVAELLDLTLNEMGNAQWIGHILKRMHLIDGQRRKRMSDGMSYSLLPEEVRDMMHRYEVDTLNEAFTV